MKKVMVFIDFENFNISLMNYYREMGRFSPRLDYIKLSKEIVDSLAGENELLKTFLFAPKPDEFLMQDSRRKSTYNWINGLKAQRYFTVIEGRHVARPVSGVLPKDMDIEKQSTYYVVEKGTDINMCTHILTKGFLGAYDSAVILSGDTDYIPVLDILNTIGKVTIVVGVYGQNLSRFREHTDDIMILNENFFNKCLRT